MGPAEAALSALAVAARGWLHLLFCGRLTGKRPRARWFFLYPAALCAIGGAASRLGQWDWAVLAMLAALYAVNRRALGNGRAPSCAAAVLAVYATELPFGLINSLESLVLPRLLGRDALFYLALALSVLAAFALCILLCRGIADRCSLGDGSPGPGPWMLVPPGLFFLTAQRYFVRTAYGAASLSPARAGDAFLLAGVQLLGLAALWAALLAWSLARSRLGSLAQAAGAQKTYMAQAGARYEQTRALRHDWNNHLAVLAGLLAEGETEQARSYLGKLRAAVGKLSFPYRSGSPVVDVLLEDKLGQARAAGAEVRVSLALPRPCGVDEPDLCVIFANALDNAVRACGESDGPRWLHVAGRRQGEFYLLEFENGCDPSGPVTMGTGLSNIRAIARRYGGDISARKEGSRFTLSVLLDLSGPRQGRP